MTSMRYQPVLNPERLQMEGSVYNPEQLDDTGPIVGERRQTFAEQIGLREIFYDPRLRVGQRTLCIGSIIFMCAVAFILLLLLILGYGRVIRDIKAEREVAKYGLQLIPDLRNETPHTLYFNSDREGRALRRHYASEIANFMDIYTKEEEGREEYSIQCKPGEKALNKWCHFDTTSNFERDGRGCTAADNYGYDSDEPCVLFAFKDEIGWLPKIRKQDATHILVECTLQYRFDPRQSANVSYYPALKSNPAFGTLPLNKLPSGTVEDDEGLDIVDDDGEILYDLPPLIFVKLPAKVMAAKRFYTLTCSINANTKGFEIHNLEKFRGITELKIDINVDIPIR